MVKYVEGKFCRQEKCIGEERAVWRGQGSVCQQPELFQGTEPLERRAASAHSCYTEHLASTVSQAFLCM